MNLTQFSIRNPLVVAALAIALALFGIYSYLTLGVSVVPSISFPAVTVTTVDPGANPDTIETQISKPIEDAVSTLNNIDTLSSTSTQGLSTVTVQFTTAANADLVGIDVERVVNGARSKLPTFVGAPTVIKADTSSFPVLTLAVSGPQPLDQLDDVAENQIKRALEAVPGVSSVSVVGAPTREIWVKADLAKLQARGLGLTSLQQALQSAQLQQPAGTLVSNSKDATVVLNGLVDDPRQLGDIVVSQTTSGPVYVRDVATVDDTLATPSSIARVDGVPAITLTASKLPSASTITVSQQVRGEMVALQPSLPQGMQMRVVTDAATYTQQSFNTIQTTLIEAVMLTGLILLLFLHTWRSTLIVMISIPTSVLTTFGLMNLLGLNLNLFSMLALTLSVGILVDDSIVVIENIARHLGLGEPPFLAAIRGRSEISMAAITITMLDVVVYVPIALISGIAGQFIRPFAIVIAAATLTSLLVSFTLTPLLASRYLTIDETLKAGGGPLNRFGRTWDRGFARLANAYRTLLHGVLTGNWHRLSGRWLVIGLGLATFAGGMSLLLTGRIGVDIFPSGDQSEVDVTLVMPSATNIQVTNDVVQQLEQRLHGYPEVRLVYSNTGTSGRGGFGGTTGGDQAQLTALLVPTNQRQRSALQLADVFRQELGRGIPDATVRTGISNAFGFGGFGGQAIQVQVQGSDPTVLNGLVDSITRAVQSTPGTADVNNDNQNVTPQYALNVDRSRAAQLGVTAQSAGTALGAAVDGLKVATYQKAGASNVDIRLIADDKFRASPDNLATLPLLTSNGTVVALNQIGTLSQTTAPTAIQHVARLRSVTINTSASEGISVGTLQTAVQASVDKVALPPGYSVTYAGQAQQGTSAFTDIFKALGVSLVLMYMLMMLLFGSITLPLAVLMSLPLAVVGAIGAMTLTGSNFTLFAMLGLTLLVGLVGKNAVLLVDYTDTLRKQGQSRIDALLNAGPVRLRPILMTSLSVMASLAPVASGIETGSELLKAAAIVLIGGLVTSTVLTLVFVPAMYTVFDDIEQAFARFVRRFAKPRQLAPVEIAILHPLHVEAFAGASPSPKSTNGHSVAGAASLSAPVAEWQDLVRR
ncbi:MAG: efflux RND transporter permease subunit [Chloroflexota bacterium]